MSKPKQTRQIGLSIFLLKQQEDIIPDELRYQGYLRPDIGTGPFPVPELPSGALWLDSKRTSTPSWLRFLDPLPAKVEVHAGAVTSAVIFTMLDGRVLALSFGRGRRLLRQGSWESGFGLKTTLSLIDPDKLRSVDKKKLDTTIQLARLQNALPGDTREFGIDIEQDLMRAVAGQPLPLSTPAPPGASLPLETMLYGGSDRLSVSIRATLHDLPALLQRYLEGYDSGRYRERFSWIDNIAEITDREEIHRLDELADSRLSKPDRGGFQLVAPELVDWSEIRGFTYKNKPREEDIYGTLDLEDLAAHMRPPMTIDALRRRHVSWITSDSNPDQLGRYFTHDRWTAARCLYGEISDSGSVFILSDLRWYRVQQDFVAHVNADVDELRADHFKFPPYVQATISSIHGFTATKKEHFYCIEAARILGDDWKTLDREKIPHGGGRSTMEFCDLVHRDSTSTHLVFAKRHLSNDHGPANLSHLLAQGYTSISALESDEGFVAKANALLDSFTTITRSQLHEVRAVFLIITPMQGPTSDILPFFTRLNLRNTARNLRRMGVQTSVYFVPTDETPSKRQSKTSAQKRAQPPSS